MENFNVQDLLQTVYPQTETLATLHGSRLPASVEEGMTKCVQPSRSIFSTNKNSFPETMTAPESDAANANRLADLKRAIAALQQTN